MRHDLLVHAPALLMANRSDQRSPWCIAVGADADMHQCAAAVNSALSPGLAEPAELEAVLEEFAQQQHCAHGPADTAQSTMLVYSFVTTWPPCP